jgi:quercetin dioxygenase-like cupin family protein
MAFEFFQSYLDEGKVEIPSMGLELSVRISTEVSGGALAVLETVNAVGFGPPLHRHHETEVFRVLEGEYLYEVDGRRFHAAAGDVVSVPGGTAHTFTNISNGPARQLVMMLPANGCARIFHWLEQGNGIRQAGYANAEYLWRTVGRGVSRASDSCR